MSWISSLVNRGLSATSTLVGRCLPLALAAPALFHQDLRRRWFPGCHVVKAISNKPLNNLFRNLSTKFTSFIPQKGGDAIGFTTWSLIIMSIYWWLHCICFDPDLLDDHYIYHIPIMHVMGLLFLWLSSIIINYHQLSSIVINCHQVSSSIINYHQLSSIIINITILFLILSLHIPVGIISISLYYPIGGLYHQYPCCSPPGNRDLPEGLQPLHAASRPKGTTSGLPGDLGLAAELPGGRNSLRTIDNSSNSFIIKIDVEICLVHINDY